MVAASIFYTIIKFLSSGSFRVGWYQLFDESTPSVFQSLQTLLVHLGFEIAPEKKTPGVESNVKSKTSVGKTFRRKSSNFPISFA